MDSRQAFKFAFIARCIEQKLTTSETLHRAKAACDMFEKSANDTVDSVVGAFTRPVNAAVDAGRSILPYALAAPPLLGGAAAYTLNRATDSDEVDIADVKRRELTDTYARMTDQLRRKHELRQFKSQRQSGNQNRPVTL